MNDTIEKVVELAAPVSRVWQAVTDHKEFGTWFKVDIDGPFRAGELSRGQFTNEGYEHVRWLAKVEAIEPETYFAFRWHQEEIDSARRLEEEPTTLVEFHLEPTEFGTRLTIRESGFAGLPEASRLESLKRNTEGWNFQADNITDYVGS